MLQYEIYERFIRVMLLKYNNKAHESGFQLLCVYQ